MDFLLVINSNLGSILPRFRDIAGFLLRRASFHPIPPEFWGVPLGLDCRCCGSENPKLIIRVINFELVEAICSRYVNVTDRRTDRRTYDLRQQYRALHYVHRAVKTTAKQTIQTPTALNDGH